MIMYASAFETGYQVIEKHNIAFEGFLKGIIKKFHCEKIFFISVLDLNF